MTCSNRLSGKSWRPYGKWMKMSCSNNGSKPLIRHPDQIHCFVLFTTCSRIPGWAPWSSGSSFGSRKFGPHQLPDEEMQSQALSNQKYWIQLLINHPSLWYITSSAGLHWGSRFTDPPLDAQAGALVSRSPWVSPAKKVAKFGSKEDQSKSAPALRTDAPQP